MKKFLKMRVGFKFFLIGIIYFQFTSCSGPKIFHFIDSQITYGLNFTTGKWILNEIECPDENKKQLTDYSRDYFSKSIGKRFSYITDDCNLLLARKRIDNFIPSELLKIQKLTTADYLINIVGKKNRNELAKIQLYSNESPGANESEVWFEVYDLKTQQKVYFEHVLGRYSKTNSKSMFEDPNHKSQKLMDNLKFNISTNELMIGCLATIVNKLDKKSIK
jgi:hypothetical protein